MKKNRRSQIATTVLALIIIAIVAFAGVSIYKKKTGEINSLQTEKLNINEELAARDSMVNELVGAFNDIEDNLRFIKEKRKMLSIETQKEGGRDQKQAIIDDIALMNEMLEKSSEHIDQLEKRLKRAGIELSSFKKKLANLNQSIEEQNSEILALQEKLEEKDILLAELNSKVDTMAIMIAQREDTLQVKEQQIMDKTMELNRGFIAYGTYKELAEHGVLKKDGGFLGLGKQVSLQNNLDESYFTQLDIRDTKTIPLFSNKATIISEHPDSSYNFIEEDGMIAYLEIENPEEFWKISKYAVIEVK
ncbi:FeoB-associated Cys-rich membrane protein [Maribellus mangrovi]|uniref:FeoB-associated Cys-rich membrane protein n=1 Tax=Maribellus mangrovi TaxID=3133146 RepID=UPI0030EE2574